MLEAFRLANLQAARKLSQQGFEFEVSEIGNLEHLPKCSVNISSDRFLCNLTMWSSGECDLLVTCDDADQVLINETSVLNEEVEMVKYLESAYSRLQDIHQGASQD